ncbi:MAG: YbaN family protein [Christensenellaceae bacterium]|nr:YbaN family protein [Christensenellaceae bacterium]
MNLQDVVFTNHCEKLIFEHNKCFLRKGTVTLLLDTNVNAYNNSLPFEINYENKGFTTLDCNKLHFISSVEILQYASNNFGINYDFINFPIKALIEAIIAKQNHKLDYNKLLNLLYENDIDTKFLEKLISELTSEMCLQLFIILLYINKTSVVLLDNLFEKLEGDVKFPYLINAVKLLKNLDISLLVYLNQKNIKTSQIDDVIIMHDNCILEYGNMTDARIQDKLKKALESKMMFNEACYDLNAQLTLNIDANEVILKEPDGTANDKNRKYSKKVLNVILLVIGSITLGLGVVGIVLPVLPSTPFFIITLVCYTKGSSKFEKWFKSTGIYKKHLEPFLKTRAMTNANKVKILLLITILISIPIILVDVLAMRIVLGLVILAHYIMFIFKVKSVSKAELNRMFEEIKMKENNDLVSKQGEESQL